jgi:regulator of protease activity HflC (stomatin/prohibitin superfamily)
MNKNMRTIIMTFLIGTIGFVTGCGPRVEVGPAEVGKIKTANGIEEQIYTPSSFRLPFNLFVKNQLITVETSHFAVKEPLEIFMPKDKLVMRFDIRGTLSISPKDSGLVFDNITPDSEDEGGRILGVSSKKVYDTYGMQIIRTKARAVVAKYDIYEVLDNMDIISQEISDACAKEFSNTPLRIQRLSLANVKPPDVIIEAQVKAKEREVAIQEAEADKLVKLKEAEAAKEVALKQQEVDLIEAETQVLVEKKLAESVSDAFIVQRALKSLDKLVESDETTVIYLPLEAMTNPAMLIGSMSESQIKR